MTNMVEGNITNQYPLTKIRNYYRMGDGILDKFPIIQDQTSPNLAHIPTTNALLQSNQFDTTWVASNSSLTSGQIGVGGSLDAWKLIENSSNSEHFIQQTPSVGGQVTISVYAKKGTRDFIYLRGVTGGVNKRSWFNLSNGTLGTIQATSATINSFGNGWYRCTATLTHDTAFEYYLGMSNADGITSYQGDGTGFIYIQYSQLEQQSQATAYLPSYGVASVRKATTTNLVLYSEDFTQSVWIKTGLIVNSNQIISPDGTLNADEVNISAANAHYLFDTISVSASTNYTFTFYVKKGSATDASYSILNATNFTNIVDTTSYFNEISDTNWTRISVKFTTPSGATSIRAYPIRDGSSTGTIYIWGSQLEQQTQAETYAPTFGLPVTIDLFTENNYGTMINMTAGDIVPDTPNN
jgi:hypothetical protein